MTCADCSTEEGCLRRHSHGEERMAETSVPAPTQFNQDGTPPLSYIVAMWLGMPHEEILRGLSDGSVVPPPGSPAGWLPAWATDGNSSDGANVNGAQNSGNSGQDSN